MSVPFNDIRLASREQLSMERAAAGQVTETTPGVVTPTIEAFAQTLQAGAPEFVPVVEDAYGLYGWCSDGVLEKIKHDGGRCIFGWTIWEWPQVMLTAEFHAVWEDTAGTLLDITPKPKSEARILFVPDRSYPGDFDFDQRPLNRRQRLHVGGDPKAAVAAAMAQLAGGKLKYEEQRAQKAGLALDEWLLSKVKPDPLTQTIDALISTCSAFEAHFDSLGTAGPVAVDARFEMLGKRRLALQKQLMQQLGRR